MVNSEHFQGVDVHFYAILCSSYQKFYSGGLRIVGRPQRWVREGKQIDDAALLAIS